MRKRRNRLARMGMLSIALLLCMCVMGVGYATWLDSVSTHGTAIMGYIQVELTAAESQQPEIGCFVASPHALVVVLTDAQPGTYTCAFIVENRGTLPVKVEGVGLSGHVPDGVAVSCSVKEGTQIEQSGVNPCSINGTVTVVVPEGDSGALTFYFQIDFSFIQWNLYGE